MSRNSEEHVARSSTTRQHVKVMIRRYALSLCNGPENCSASRVVLPQGCDESHNLQVVDVIVTIVVGRSKRPRAAASAVWHRSSASCQCLVVCHLSDCPTSDSQRCLLDPPLIDLVDVKREELGKIAPRVVEHVVRERGDVARDRMVSHRHRYGGTPSLCCRSLGATLVLKADALALEFRLSSGRPAGRDDKVQARRACHHQREEANPYRTRKSDIGTSMTFEGEVRPSTPPRTARCCFVLPADAQLGGGFADGRGAGGRRRRRWAEDAHGWADRRDGVGGPRA